MRHNYLFCALAVAIVFIILQNPANADVNPIQKKWYQVYSVFSGNKKAVGHADHAGCAELQRTNFTKSKTQMWAFLPAGNDFYFMCSRMNGNCVAYKNLGFGLLSVQTPRAEDEQMLRINKKDNGEYELAFKKNDHVLHDSRDLTSCSAQQAIKHRSRDGKDRKRQRFKLHALADIVVPASKAGDYQPGAIPTPPPPAGARPEDAPPSETGEVAIGQIAMPYMMIKDSAYNREQQIRYRAVYYILERSQNWVLQKYQNYDPGKNRFVWNWKHGMSKTTGREMETTTNVKIMADFNFKYEGFAGDLKGEFQRTLRVKESSSTTEMDETSGSHEWEIDAKVPFSIAQWQLQDNYNLYRQEHNKKVLIKSWKLIDDRYNYHNTYPQMGVSVIENP
jgi:hypothetical protein